MTNVSIKSNKSSKKETITKSAKSAGPKPRSSAIKKTENISATAELNLIPPKPVSIPQTSLPLNNPIILPTKRARVLDLLKASEGASIVELMQATSWQRHSVRGFLSGTIKKKLGLSLISTISEQGLRRYKIIEQSQH
ncbi:MAG: DUF3489 domain-containing protein [Methylocystaceae bacterium]|nr:DUF3489 domain-containing protein [Methylocystaceae bacterium]